MDISDEDDDEEDIERLQNETVLIDFEFFSPTEIDFVALKTTLATYLDGNTLDTSALVDTIIQQGKHSLGSVIKVPMIDDEEDEPTQELEYSDPFGICTVINLSQHKVPLY